MTATDEQIAAALAEGRTMGSVVRDLGVPRSRVLKVNDPEAHRARLARANANANARKRAWERANDRGRCACGAPTGIGAARRGTVHCRDCEVEMRQLARAMREERIAALWLEGRSFRDIAVALGSPGLQISPYLAAMRAKGWDLPYRRAGWVPGTNAKR